MADLESLRPLACRYAGFPAGKITPRLLRAEAMAAVLPAAAQAVAYIEKSAPVQALFTPFPDAVRLLLCCTALHGAAKERVDALMLTEPDTAVLLDAYASALVETAQMQLRERQARALQNQGLFLSNPLVPGCGCLSAECHQTILTLCDAARKIGLYAHASGALMPGYSAVWVCAVQKNPARPQNKCERCADVNSCRYRKGFHDDTTG